MGRDGEVKERKRKRGEIEQQRERGGKDEKGRGMRGLVILRRNNADLGAGRWVHVYPYTFPPILLQPINPFLPPHFLRFLYPPLKCEEYL